eukprot:3262281-Amphidinium_carterae.1
MTCVCVCVCARAPHLVHIELTLEDCSQIFHIGITDLANKYGFSDQANDFCKMVKGKDDGSN